MHHSRVHITVEIDSVGDLRSYRPRSFCLAASHMEMSCLGSQIIRTERVGTIRVVIEAQSEIEGHHGATMKMPTEHGESVQV